MTEPEPVEAMSWEEAADLEECYRIVGNPFKEGSPADTWCERAMRAIALARQERERAERADEEVKDAWQAHDAILAAWQEMYELKRDIEARADLLAEAVEGAVWALKSIAKNKGNVNDPGWYADDLLEKLAAYRNENGDPQAPASGGTESG